MGGDCMRQSAVFLVSVFLLFLTACSPSEPIPETTIPETISVTVPETEPVPDTLPTETAPDPTETETVPELQVQLNEEEKMMLLKLGMAERGETECTECIALVMRTVLNRVNADRFGSNIRSVILAPKQFIPIWDGTYYTAEPNERCYEALDMVIYGWDESQGALYYEWCEGESWHSQNLHLLFQHCDTRFYD